VNLDRVKKIADAVLYEGYMLYPYRISSIKNRQRWNFGVLYPRFYCESQCGSDASNMQTECLMKATPLARITVKVRFLQVVRRSIGKLLKPAKMPLSVDRDVDFVDRLEVAGRVYQPWQETFERELSFSAMKVASLNCLQTMSFSFPRQRRVEYLRDEHGATVGVVVRDWEMLNGSVQFSAGKLRDGVVKITVRTNNLVSFDSAPVLDPSDREAVLPFSLVSAHTILGVEDGEFLSLLDPPEALKNLATQCRNVGTWPVLAGEPGESVISSPIILYDYPQIAPESAGNLFDSTEIDEILSLRILTLTNEEKREVRESDDRAREILERTENMPEEQIMKLHGVLRGMKHLTEETQ
jgi:hypothetical protein